MTEAERELDRAAALHEQAIVWREEGRFAEAEALCREAVRLFETFEDANSPNLANALVEHGRLLESLDRLAEAGPPVERALAILRPWLAQPVGDGATDDERAVEEELLRLIVRAETRLGSILRQRGQLDDAAAIYARTVELAEARLPPDDLLLAETLNGLGVVHKFQGRYDQAESVYLRALAIVEAAHQDDDRATLLHNLGGLAHARGDFAGGEPLARRSLELREELYGADHPGTAADRAAWGALLEGLGRYDEAEDAYRRALAVFEERLGPRSLEAASALTALGSLWHARGALGEAEEAYRRSLEIREAVLAPSHFDVGLTLNNLAMLLVDRGAVEEARRLLGRAEFIFETALGRAHPHTRAVIENVAALAGKSAD